MSADGTFGRVTISIVVLVVIGVVFMAQNCTQAQTPKLTRALEQQGYSDVAIGGFSLGCGDGDGLCKSFTAKGPTGVLVRGSVGCGYWFKGCTVRLQP